MSSEPLSPEPSNPACPVTQAQAHKSRLQNDPAGYLCCLPGQDQGRRLLHSSGQLGRSFRDLSLARARGSSVWKALRVLWRKAEATKLRGQGRLHQWLPQRLPREKARRRPSPLVPGALGMEGRGRVSLSGAGAQGMRAGDCRAQPDSLRIRQL